MDDDKKNDTKKTQSKNTTDVKAEVFFPQLYFFTLLQKVVFFNFLSNFNSDAKLGPRLSALWTQSKFRLIFLRFYQRFSKMELQSPFSFWIVLLFLSILHFKNKTLILLKCCFVHLLSRAGTVSDDRHSAAHFP